MLDFKKQVFLVVAPHPDDEVLGCGGLISKIKAHGGKVYILYLTVGNTRDYSRSGKSSKKERLAEIAKVTKFLGVDGWEILFPGDSYHLLLDKIPKKELIDAIDNGSRLSLKLIKPTIIATTQSTDYNQDHRACAEACFAVSRPMPHNLKPFQQIVLGYEYAPSSWSISAQNQPNFYVELTKPLLFKKVRAMALYASQSRNGSHARSSHTIRSLAYLRGSQSGVWASEAYVNYRILT